MTVDDLKKLVGEEKAAEVDELISDIQTAANPLAGFTETKLGSILKAHPELAKAVDSRISKGVETSMTKFREAELPKLVQAEYEKEHPPETPEQKAIKELRDEIKRANEKTEAAERRAAAQERRERLRNTLTEKGLPADAVQFFSGESDEDEQAFLESAEGILSSYAQQVRDTALKAGGRVPQKGENGSGNGKFLSIEQINELSADPKMFAQNQDKIMESIAYHQALERQ